MSIVHASAQYAVPSILFSATIPHFSTTPPVRMNRRSLRSRAEKSSVLDKKNLGSSWPTKLHMTGKKGLAWVLMGT